MKCFHFPLKRLIHQDYGEIRIFGALNSHRVKNPDKYLWMNFHTGAHAHLLSLQSLAKLRTFHAQHVAERRKVWGLCVISFAEVPPVFELLQAEPNIERASTAFQMLDDAFEGMLSVEEGCEHRHQATIQMMKSGLPKQNHRFWGPDTDMIVALKTRTAHGGSQRSSKQKLQCQLDLPWRPIAEGVRGLEPAKLRRVEYSLGHVKVGAIEYIEKFESKLKNSAFRQWKDLQQ
jgi:hypothetical protein